MIIRNLFTIAAIIGFIILLGRLTVYSYNKFINDSVANYTKIERFDNLTPLTVTSDYTSNISGCPLDKGGYDYPLDLRDSIGLMDGSDDLIRDGSYRGYNVRSDEYSKKYCGKCVKRNPVITTELFNKNKQDIIEGNLDYLCAMETFDNNINRHDDVIYPRQINETDLDSDEFVGETIASIYNKMTAPIIGKPKKILKMTNSEIIYEGDQYQ